MKPRPDYKPLTRVNGVISSMGLQKSILERQRHNEIVRNHNKIIYEQGTDWAYLGHNLDEAPEELKNREDFISYLKTATTSLTFISVKLL